jgi:hypothetical protein
MQIRFFGFVRGSSYCIDNYNGKNERYGENEYMLKSQQDYRHQSRAFVNSVKQVGRFSGHFFLSRWAFRADGPKLHGAEIPVPAVGEKHNDRSVIDLLCQS